MLLLTFPELKMEEGAVSQALTAIGANEGVVQTWRELVEAELIEQDDAAEFE